MNKEHSQEEAEILEEQILQEADAMMIVAKSLELTAQQQQEFLNRLPEALVRITEGKPAFYTLDRVDDKVKTAIQIMANSQEVTKSELLENIEEQAHQPIEIPKSDSETPLDTEPSESLTSDQGDARFEIGTDDNEELKYEVRAALDEALFEVSKIPEIPDTAQRMEVLKEYKQTLYELIEDYGDYTVENLKIALANQITDAPYEHMQKATRDVFTMVKKYEDYLRHLPEEDFKALVQSI